MSAVLRPMRRVSNSKAISRSSVGWLVAFDREMIVRVAPDDIACQRALGQQRIARDVLAGDVAPFKQGDRLADFVGALRLITTLDG